VDTRRVSNALEQDDLYVDMTFAKVLDDKGSDAHPPRISAPCPQFPVRTGHANAAGRRNLRRGFRRHSPAHPGTTCTPTTSTSRSKRTSWASCAGTASSPPTDLQPRGRIVNYGDGIYGGMFVSGMYGRRVLRERRTPGGRSRTGLRARQSKYARLIADVLAWSDSIPATGEKCGNCWADKWDRAGCVSVGALRAYTSTRA